MRNRHHASGDSESLQADVMRFMAIIGFCLVAILGLVRDVEQNPQAPQEPRIARVAGQPAAETPEPSAAARPAVEPKLEPKPKPSPPQPIAASRPAKRTIMIRRPDPEPLPEPEPTVPDQEPTIAAVLLEPEPEFEPEPDPELDEAPAREPPLEPPAPMVELADSEADPAPTAQPAPAATPPVPEPGPQGLSLRFVSDGDFLRLIARGDVTVFALSEGEILGLGQDYEFRSASAPKRIYELHQDTLPTLVSDAFRRDVRGSEQYTWGVSLPHRIEAQIRDYVDRVDNGVLLIDRFGDVRHVGNS